MARGAQPPPPWSLVPGGARSPQAEVKKRKSIPILYITFSVHVALTNIPERVGC